MWHLVDGALVGAGSLNPKVQFRICDKTFLPTLAFTRPFVHAIF
jgi:hypothetical protein